MEFLKKNWSTVLIALATVVLAGVAVFTALRLYQLRQSSVSPTVPESKPAAQTPTCGANECLDQTTNTCLDTSQQGNTACGTGGVVCQVCATGEYCNNGVCESTACNVISFTLAIPTTTPTAIPTSTPPTQTPTPTPTPTITQPPVTATPTVTKAPTTPTPTKITVATPTSQPELPAAGVSTPTLIGASAGILLLIFALALAL